MRVLVVPLFFYVSLIDTLPSESFQGTHKFYFQLKIVFPAQENTLSLPVIMYLT